MNFAIVMMIRLGFFLFCSLFIVQSFAQLDTIVTIDSVIITAKPLRMIDPGGKVSSWSKNESNGATSTDLADLASENNFAFIKSYGSGGLATPSVRGGNAGQTMVLWNGIPLHSPMLGQLDFSLLSLSFADEISLRPGGSTSLWGSGAIAGIITFDNNFEQEGLINLESELGSYRQANQNVQIFLGKKHLKSITRLLFQSARNNFPYEIVPRGPVKYLENAETIQKGFMQSLQYLFSNNKKITFHFWYQNTDRQIPPLLTQSKSLSEQADISSRFMLAYENYHTKGYSQIKLAFFSEQNNYKDPIIGLDNANSFQTTMLDYNKDWRFKHRVRLSVGSTHSYTQAHADAYQTVACEYRGSIFASAKLDLNRFSIMSVFRKEWVDAQFVPLTPSVSLQYRLSPAFLLKGKLSRDYRLPTLNDRYWIPGGNISLKPESGWSEEIGVSFSKQLNAFFYWKYEITGFNRIINDWILWSSKEGQAFFSPHNIAKVWSRGLEQRLKLSRSWNNHLNTVILDLNYSLIKSTNQVEIVRPRLQKGEQLIYTPIHQGSISASLKLRNGGFSYHHAFAGQFSGINQDLPGYQTGNLKLFRNLVFLGEKMELFFRVNNIWDHSYQVIENRPMPGRHYMGGFKIDIE